MKKSLVFIICLLLVACNSEKIGEKEQLHPPVTITPLPAEAYEKDSSAVISNVVIDETGKKCKLNMVDVDVEDQGIYMRNCYSDVWMYSQIEDGHYYYMQCQLIEDCKLWGFIYDDFYRYKIYKDKEECIGEFEFESDVNEIEGIIKFEGKFYVSYGTIFESTLCYVNFAEKRLVPLCVISNDYVDMDTKNLGLLLYKGNLYYESYNEKRQEPQLGWRSLDGTTDKSYFPENTILQKEKPYYSLVDNKLYYAVPKEKKVSIYQYDLESKKEERILQFNTKKKLPAGEICINMDDKYIYCHNYMIPRQGGKILTILRKIKKRKSEPIIYCMNSKYIFYVDNKERLHRFEKKTKKDTIISNIIALDVECTEKEIYVKSSDSGTNLYFNDDDIGYEYTATVTCDTYCMDLNGNVKKKWHESP